MRPSQLLALPMVVLAPQAVNAATVGPLMTLEASPAMASQRAPAVAWDGTRYVIVWEDGRTPASGLELYLARIGADGALLDANGLSVLTPAQPGDQTQPVISYGATAGAFVMSWIDPRSGSAEVYSARFFPAGGGLFTEPGGVALTNTAADAESRPAIDCAPQSCMVAFQQTSVGVTQIRGVRVYPSGDPQDATPIDLVLDNTGRSSELGVTVTATGSTFLIAWEDDRNRATGLLGADLYGRIAPDLGAIAPLAGTQLVSADYRQSVPSLAVLSGTQVIAVWQDQRAGIAVPATDDVWRGRYNLSFAAVGGGAALNASAGAQQFPKIAGRNGRGVVAWQDFRNGAFGATYATRIDATGASLDGAGFPVISYNANVIEHAIAKGPGNDYLIAAVRGAPAPTRIAYRIVRDEPPAGPMTAPANIAVAADGAAVAMVTFGPARGASGFPLVDGTPYTLTLSSASPTITVPDADPISPGHQLTTVGGQLIFGLTSLRPEQVTASVASTEGTSVGTVIVTFNNVPPTVSAVTISPANPRSSEDLALSYTYADTNGDPESGTLIQWTRNSAVQPQYTGMRTVPASATSRDDLWRAQVRPSDGRDLAPAFTFSNSVLILNTAPGAVMVRIEPGTGVKTGTPLSARYNYVDPDGDPESGSRLRWFRDGVEVPALQNQQGVPGAQVVKGQRWRIDVLPSDGTESGPLVSSATVGVENSVPVADPGENTSVLERRAISLSGAASSDLDPADVLAFSWRQVSGSTVTLSATNTATISFTAPSVPGTAQLIFGLTVSDGEATSTEETVVVLVTPVPDQDGDGLDEEEEVIAGTDPRVGDTDRDGASDGAEFRGGSDPLDEDSDDDGVRDGAEVEPFADSDGDSLVNAMDPDSDDDGLFDGTELGVTDPPPGTDRMRGNFIADADRETMTDPIDADTDGDQLDDGVEDQNHNGRVDLGESDPLDATSTVGCMPDMSCPSGLSCIANACRVPGGDGGMSCVPLSARGTECCAGGCSGGTLVAPVCDGPGRAERCGGGASECRVGSCSTDPTGPGGDEGCGCTTAGTGSVRAPSVAVLLLALLLLRPRRSRAARPTVIDSR